MAKDNPSWGAEDSWRPSETRLRRLRALRRMLCPLGNIGGATSARTSPDPSPLRLLSAHHGSLCEAFQDNKRRETSLATKLWSEVSHAADPPYWTIVLLLRPRHPPFHFDHRSGNRSAIARSRPYHKRSAAYRQGLRTLLKKSMISRRRRALSALRKREPIRRIFGDAGFRVQRVRGVGATAG